MLLHVVVVVDVDLKMIRDELKKYVNQSFAAAKAKTCKSRMCGRREKN